MKILLLGEYSRLHNSLKEGLVKQGHEVFLAGYGDYFKNYPVDFRFDFKYASGFRKTLKNLLYRFTGIDFHSKDIYKTFKRNQELFSGYDIVQLINEQTFKTRPKTEITILKHIFNQNKKVFLLSCGTDYISVKFAYDKKLRYSILSPYFNGKLPQKSAKSILQYITPAFKKLHNYLFNNIEGVIASDLDYHLPLQFNPKYLGLIPNPINIDKLEFIPLVLSDKIKIFHGINRDNYYKKGHDIFEKALAKINQKYSDRVEIIQVENLPYKDYIKSYDEAHIILDQVYSYDQGYNALEAMAKGKVVFTGAEQEWLDHYKLEQDTVAINAFPDSSQISEKLEWLVKNPEILVQISRNARQFVENHHDYNAIAEKYLEVWSS